MTSENLGSSNTPSLTEKTLKQVLEIPGIKVDRETFLKKSFSKYIDDKEKLDEIADKGPLQAGLSKDLVEKIAKKTINFHRNLGTAKSFGAGLPGGWWMAASIPADVAQVLYHHIVMCQKISFIYGNFIFSKEPIYKNGTDTAATVELNNSQFDDDDTNTILLLLGVAFGSQKAVNAFREVMKVVGDQVGKKLVNESLTKYNVYNLSKQILKYIGIQLNKKMFGTAVGRAIPVVAGGVGGAVTYYTIGRNGKRLIKHLNEIDDERKNFRQQSNNTYTTPED